MLNVRFWIFQNILQFSSIKYVSCSAVVKSLWWWRINEWFWYDIIAPEKIEVIDNPENLSVLTTEANNHVVDEATKNTKELEPNKKRKKPEKIPWSHGNATFFHILKIEKLKIIPTPLLLLGPYPLLPPPCLLILYIFCYENFLFLPNFENFKMRRFYF